MIRKAKSEIYHILDDYIDSNKLKNVYLYIDKSIYGYCGDNVETYVVESSDDICAVIYQYYNSIQLLEITELGDVFLKEVAEFIIGKKYIRVSGPSRIVNKIYEFVDEFYTVTNGFLMQFTDTGNNDVLSEETFFASERQDFKEIAKLICNDQHLGKSYVESNLAEQLISRYKNDGCENLCFKIEGKIVSHFATYAVTDNIAVVSGMVTANEHRRKGIGSLLVRELSAYVVKKGKTPLLYCYEEEYFDWYQKLGYSIVGTSSKMELINK